MSISSSFMALWSKTFPACLPSTVRRAHFKTFSRIMRLILTGCSSSRWCTISPKAWVSCTWHRFTPMVSSSRRIALSTHDLCWKLPILDSIRWGRTLATSQTTKRVMNIGRVRKRAFLCELKISIYISQFPYSGKFSFRLLFMLFL